jgi:hypothetical protein
MVCLQGFSNPTDLKAVSYIRNALIHYCSSRRVLAAEETEPQEERKNDTPLDCSGRTALRREQCGVIAPCRSCCSTEISQRDCATVVSDVFPLPSPRFPSSRFAPHHTFLGEAVNVGSRNSEGSRDIRDVTLQ